MNDLISRQDAIDALKICDNNYDGIICHKCPLRDERWGGAWYDEETTCYTKLMRDSAKLLELPSAQPEIVRCHECKWFGRIGCAISIVDDSDKPTENDFCSFAERKGENDEPMD